MAGPTTTCNRAPGTHTTAPAPLKGKAAPRGHRSGSAFHQPQHWGQPWHEETETSPISLCLLLLPLKDPSILLPAAPLCQSLSPTQGSWPGGSPASSCYSIYTAACPVLETAETGFPLLYTPPNP